MTSEEMEMRNLGRHMLAQINRYLITRRLTNDDPRDDNFSWYTGYLLGDFMGKTHYIYTTLDSDWPYILGVRDGYKNEAVFLIQQANMAALYRRR